MNHPPMNHRYPSLVLAIPLTALALALAACGGGGSGTNTNSSAATNQTASEKEFASGTVTGFGSVIVEGVRYDDSSARVQIEVDPAAPKAIPVSDLKLGMSVIVKVLKAGLADTVVSGSEVLGPITSLTSDGFVVAGQTVKVSTDAASPTVFDGITSLSDLAVNDRVEVHGTRDTSNNIVASRIERKSPTDLIMTRVVGAVANLDATAKTFTIGGLPVTYGATTRFVPSTANATTLANGQVVVVFSSASPTLSGITAKTIGVKTSTTTINPDDADKAWVGGHVRSLDFAAKTFKLNGFTVDASTATYSNGTVNDLANARKVRVTGVFAAGILKAATVKFAKSQGDAAVQLIGPVSDFVSSSSFKVRGVPVDASGTGIVFENGTLANLADGVAINMEGVVVNDVVKPTKISFVTTDEGKVRNFVGEVQSFNAASDTFKLMGVDMKLSSTASFKNSDLTTALKSEFGNTDRVQVRGGFVAGVFNVTEVIFRPGASVVVTRTEGGITQVDGQAGVFKVNGVTVRTNGSTQFDATINNLRTGARVEVEGTLVNGEIVARTVSFHDPEDNVKAQVSGDVTDYVSLSDFRVNGQKVDASTATLENGTASKLANGARVEAKGAVLNGVLKADKLRFK